MDLETGPERSAARSAASPHARLRPRRSEAALALALMLVLAAGASARPTHGPIEPLEPGVELEGLAYLPLEVGRTATFRDGAGNRYRQIITTPAPLLPADQKIRDRLRRRLVYEMPASGGTQLIERRILEIDPSRGVIARPDEAERGGAPPVGKKGVQRRKATAASAREVELPARLAAHTSWTANGIEHRVRGLADVEVEAGSFARCVVVDAKNARELANGESGDMRSFYCPGVGEVAVLMMVNGAWRPAVELERVTTTDEAGVPP